MTERSFSTLYYHIQPCDMVNYGENSIKRNTVYLEHFHSLDYCTNGNIFETILKKV